MALFVSDIPEQLRLPCPCKIWRKKDSYLAVIRDVGNERYFTEKNTALVCQNVAASLLHEVDGDVFGSWVLDFSHSTDNKLMWLLKEINGKVEGTTEDLIRIRITSCHSHLQLTQL